MVSNKEIEHLIMRLKRAMGFSNHGRMRLKRIEELKETLFKLDTLQNNDCAEKMLDANLNNIYQISTESTMTFEEAADNINAIVFNNGITVNEAIRKMKGCEQDDG